MHDLSKDSKIENDIVTVDNWRINKKKKKIFTKYSNEEIFYKKTQLSLIYKNPRLRAPRWTIIYKSLISFYFKVETLIPEQGKYHNFQA